MADDYSENYAIRLFRESLFTDFVIECGEYQISVHKYCLFARSDYFRKLFSTSCKEVMESKVTFTDIQPSLVVRAVISCYEESSYPNTLGAGMLPASCAGLASDDTFTEADNDSFMAAHLAIEMHILGGRWGMSNLQYTANRCFNNAYFTPDKSDTTPAAMYDKDKCSRLIRCVYALPQDGNGFIRNRTSRNIIEHIRTGTHQRDTSRFIKNIIAELPDLTKDVLEDYLSGAPSNFRNTITLDIQFRKGSSQSLSVIDTEEEAIPEHRMLDIFNNASDYKETVEDLSEWKITFKGKTISQHALVEQLVLGDRDEIIFEHRTYIDPDLVD